MDRTPDEVFPIYMDNLNIETRKRPRSASPPEVNSPGGNFARFLVVSAENAEQSANFQKLSPFGISKQIMAIAGQPEQVKKLRSGALLVQVNKKSHSDNLLKTTMFLNIPVKITPHRTLNFCKGTIFSRELIDESDDSIVTELSSQGVTGAKRILRKDSNGELQKTHTIILTFSNPTLPDAIVAGYLKIKVRPYIPNPLRCFRCQKFGHGVNNCNFVLEKNKDKICDKCAEQHAISTKCPSLESKMYKCFNCNGNHPSYSKECPVWKKEKEISRIKFTQNITFPEARKSFEQTNSTIATNTVTYSEALRAKPKKCTDSSTNTDLSLPPNADFEDMIKYMQQKNIEQKIAEEKRKAIKQKEIKQTSTQSTSQNTNPLPASKNTNPATPKNLTTSKNTNPQSTQKKTTVSSNAKNKNILPNSKDKGKRKTIHSDRLKKAEKNLVKTRNKFEVLSSESDDDDDLSEGLVPVETDSLFDSGDEDRMDT